MGELSRLLFFIGEFKFLWENIPKSHPWQNPGHIMGKDLVEK